MKKISVVYGRYTYTEHKKIFFQPLECLVGLIIDIYSQNRDINVHRTYHYFSKSAADRKIPTSEAPHLDPSPIFFFRNMSKGRTMMIQLEKICLPMYTCRT